MSDVLQQILKKHNINETTTNAKNMDDENRIFISDNYVIKIYFPQKFNYYYNELDVYTNLKDKKYLPKLYFYGEGEGYKYIIISRLKGLSLFECWDKSSKIQRIDYVKQIALILKDINQIHVKKSSFEDILNLKFYATLDKLKFSEAYKSKLLELYLQYSQYFNNPETLNLIHIDIHFYNFFVNDGEIYAYDFENLMMSPLEYQLLRWYRMWKYPQTFIYPKNSLTDDQIKSYDLIMPTLLDCYPELCSNKNFDERLKTYLLIYLLEEAKRCKLSELEVKKYIDENIKIKVRGLI